MCVTGTVIQQNSHSCLVLVIFASRPHVNTCTQSPVGGCPSPHTGHRLHRLFCVAGPEASGEGVQAGQRHPGGEGERDPADPAPAGLRQRGCRPEQRRAGTGELSRARSVPGTERRT